MVFFVVVDAVVVVAAVGVVVVAVAVGPAEVFGLKFLVCANTLFNENSIL